MAQDLSGLYISQSFQNLVQASASGAFNVLATATGTEFIPISASYAISASVADSSDTTISASHAVNADSADTSISASHAVNADSAISASHAIQADTATLAINTTYAANTIVTGKSLEATTIFKGTPLYFTGSGTSGNLVGVYRADAGNPARMPAGGIAGEDMDLGDEGVVLLDGFVNGVDTSIFASGDEVFVGVGGGYTNVAPTGSSNLIQHLGNVEKSAINGSGVIQMMGEPRGLPNIQEDYLWLGDADGVPQAVPSSSLKTPAFPFTGSAGISGSLDVNGDTIVSKNQAGSNATLIIRDDAQSSFTDGPTLQFSGSNVGLIKSQAATNLKIEADRDFLIDVGDGGTGAQFSFNLVNNQTGDFNINDQGHRSALYQHENLTQTGSIRFADTSNDVGIAIRMDNDKMGLQMFSGSSFVPIIERKASTRNINIYDSFSSTGSNGQVLSSNAGGGIEWVVSGGGGSIFPFTGSAGITGSLDVVGPTNITGSLIVDGTISGSFVGTATLPALTDGDGITDFTYDGSSAATVSIEDGGVTTVKIADGDVTNAKLENDLVTIGTTDITLGAAATTKISGLTLAASETSGSFTINGGISQNNAGLSTYFGTNAGADGLANPASNRFSSAFGYGALQNATGTQNAAFGGDSLQNLTSGGSNAAFGLGSLKDNISGGTNTAIGWQALNLITSGSSNIGIGANAGRQIVSTPGNPNINSENSVFVGYQAYPLNSSETNQIVIGANAEGKGSNTVVLGNNSITDTFLKGNIHGTGSLLISGSMLMTGSAEITGSLDIVGPTTITGSLALGLSGSIELAGNTGSADQVISVDAGGVAHWADASGGGGGVTAFSNVVQDSLAGPQTSDTTFTQVLIPAGTFGAGDILQVKALTKQDYGGGGTIYCNMGFSPTSGSGGTNYGSWAAGDKQAAIYDKTICIVTADGTGDGTVALKFGSNIDAVDNGLETFPDGPNGRSVNWNNDVYLFINAYVDNAGSSIENRFLNIMKIN